MKKAILFLLLLLIFMIMFGWTVGSFAHWFYYTVMIIFSKLTFAFMYGLAALIILVMGVALFSKWSHDK